jgi:hypothetical protein
MEGERWRKRGSIRFRLREMETERDVLDDGRIRRERGSFRGRWKGNVRGRRRGIRSV